MASSYGDSWADIYDSVHTYVEDIPFWIEEAQASGGPVLELACGTGRVTIPIAQAGVPVVGLDNSARMLKVARAKARRLGLGAGMSRFVQGDMRAFSLSGQTFPLIIIPFRSFQLLLSVAEQHQALATIAKHLVPGGRLVFSLFVPDLEYLASNRSVPVYDHESRDLITGHRLLVWHQEKHDSFNQVMDTRTIVEELDDRAEVVRETHVEFQMRYLYRFEAQHLLEACKFRILDVYGSFQRDPLEESSTEMIWVAMPT